MRLYVVAEGLTEMNFVQRILSPHLESVSGNRLFATAVKLGGEHTYARLKKMIQNLLKAGAVTTMIDLFRPASDFPGLRNDSDIDDAYQRVLYLEQAFRDDIGVESFIPYLQLHEFEALLITDLNVLAQQHPNREREIRELAARLNREFDSPEHVNRTRPPSKWILDAVPEYRKPVDGVVTAERIGLVRMREGCAHFSAWIASLELLAQEA